MGTMKTPHVVSKTLGSKADTFNSICQEPPGAPRARTEEKRLVVHTPDTRPPNTLRAQGWLCGVTLCATLMWHQRNKTDTSTSFPGQETLPQRTQRNHTDTAAPHPHRPGSWTL